MDVINKPWFPDVVSGIPLQTKDGTKTGETSVKAAQKGISMVVASRVLMASPGNSLNKTCFSSIFQEKLQSNLGNSILRGFMSSRTSWRMSSSLPLLTYLDSERQSLKLQLYLLGMILVPMFADLLEKRGVLAKYPRINAPTQILLCGFFLTFATPLCCAIFPQVCPFLITIFLFGKVLIQGSI